MRRLGRTDTGNFIIEVTPGELERITGQSVEVSTLYQNRQSELYRYIDDAVMAGRIDTRLAAPLLRCIQEGKPPLHGLSIPQFLGLLKTDRLLEVRAFGRKSLQRLRDALLDAK